jgi:hypothetical protein
MPSLFALPDPVRQLPQAPKIQRPKIQRPKIQRPKI